MRVIILPLFTGNQNNRALINYLPKILDKKLHSAHIKQEKKQARFKAKFTSLSMHKELGL